MVDDELLNALGQGNIISVGASPDGKKPPELETLPNIEININIEQYNHPIGIDFTKSLPPLYYITLSELLEKLLDLTNLSNECRFELETFHNYIVQGKIAEFRETIQSLEQSTGSASKKQSKIETSDQSYTNLVKFLLLFLHIPPKKETRWLAQEKFATLLESKTDIKKMLKEYRQNSSLTSDSIQYITIILTLISLLQKYQGNTFNHESILQLQLKVINQDYIQAEKILSEKSGIKYPFSSEESNENFVKSSMLSFKYFLE